MKQSKEIKYGDRPVLCECEQCGDAILSRDEYYHGDDYVEVPDGKIHYECVFDWARDNRKGA